MNRAVSGDAAPDQVPDLQALGFYEPSSQGLTVYKQQAVVPKAACPQGMLADLERARREHEQKQRPKVIFFAESIVGVAYCRAYQAAPCIDSQGRPSAQQHVQMHNGRPYRGSTVDVVQDYNNIIHYAVMNDLPNKHSVNLSELAMSPERLAQAILENHQIFWKVWADEGILVQVTPVHQTSSTAATVQLELWWPDLGAGF